MKTLRKDSKYSCVVIANNEEGREPLPERTWLCWVYLNGNRCWGYVGPTPEAAKKKAQNDLGVEL